MTVWNPCSNHFDFEKIYEAFQTTYHRVVATAGETESPKESYGGYFLQRSTSQDGWERYFYSNDQKNWTKDLLSKWVTIGNRKYKIQATEEGVVTNQEGTVDWFYVVTFRWRDENNKVLTALSPRQCLDLKEGRIDNNLHLLLSALQVFK